MHKKQIVIITATILVVILAGVVWQRRAADHVHTGDEQSAIYYCPMHPSVTSDKPGNCPICGMKLVRRTGSQSADVAAQLAQSGVSLSTAQQVMANVRTVKVTPSATTNDFVTTGRVAIDERRLAQVTSYTAGRIEQLLVNFTGDSVVRGRAVATIYSPDLFATQQEYLLALRNRERMQRSGFPEARSAADDLAESSRRKLSLFGMTSGQIERLATERRPFYTTTIVAPVSGIVTRKDVVPQQYVMQGQPLFEIADLSTVWVEADVYEKDLALVQPGQRVSVLAPAFPGVELPARVSFIQPLLEGESRTNRVRIELPNRGLRLKPEMYVTVRFFGESAAEQLMVPASAVVDRGLEQFVWVEVSPGNYEPRRVQVGRRTAGRVEIVSGLQSGESIVAEGAFLLDSEAQLRSAGANHGSHGS